MTRRIQVLYRGRVQGVGFRATAESLARNHPAVTGFVRNLPDGTVELVAEGDPRDLDGFLASIDRALGRFIAGSEIADLPVVHQPSSSGSPGFAIRHD